MAPSRAIVRSFSSIISTPCSATHTLASRIFSRRQVCLASIKPSLSTGWGVCEQGSHNRPRHSVKPLCATFSRNTNHEFYRQYSTAPLSNGQNATQSPYPPENLDSNERAIFDKLLVELQPTELVVQDTSGGCGSMYSISIASPAFAGLPVVRQHRLVTKVLAAEIASWHGLQLVTKAA